MSSGPPDIILGYRAAGLDMRTIRWSSRRDYFSFPLSLSQCSPFASKRDKFNWGSLHMPTTAGETTRMPRLCQLKKTALLLAVYGVRSAQADDPIRILYPDEKGLEFHYLDRIDVSYESNFTAPYLYIWCGQGSAKQKQMDRPDGGNATTEITLKFEADQDLANDCWFNLRIHDLADSSPLGANSPAFTYLHASRQGGPVS